VAHPCPARAPPSTPTRKGHTIHDNIIVATLDAIEIAEILAT
jgi:hypothetical protein